MKFIHFKKAYIYIQQEVDDKMSGHKKHLLVLIFVKKGNAAEQQDVNNIWWNINFDVTQRYIRTFNCRYWA